MKNYCALWRSVVPVVDIGFMAKAKHLKGQWIERFDLDVVFVVLDEFAKQLLKQVSSFVMSVCPFVIPSVAMSLYMEHQSPTGHIFTKFYIADIWLQLLNTEVWLELGTNTDT